MLWHFSRQVIFEGRTRNPYLLSLHHEICAIYSDSNRNCTTKNCWLMLKPYVYVRSECDVRGRGTRPIPWSSPQYKLGNMFWGRILGSVPLARWDLGSTARPIYSPSTAPRGVGVSCATCHQTPTFCTPAIMAFQLYCLCPLSLLLLCWVCLILICWSGCMNLSLRIFSCRIQ